MRAAGGYDVNIRDSNEEQRAASLAYGEEKKSDEPTHGTVKAFADLALVVHKT